jgi:hypothetical protein
MDFAQGMRLRGLDPAAVDVTPACALVRVASTIKREEAHRLRCARGTAPLALRDRNRGFLPRPPFALTY